MAASTASFGDIGPVSERWRLDANVTGVPGRALRRNEQSAATCCYSDMTEAASNRLLRVPGVWDCNRILERCDRHRLHAGDILSEAGTKQDVLYFPTSGVVSTIEVYSDGRSIEVATIGCEGCVGLGLLLSGNRAIATNRVGIAGEAHVLQCADFLDLTGKCPPFRSVLLAYAQAYMTQLVVSAACNGVHPLRQRLARWLLTMKDRCGSREFTLTQQFLADALGVQRPSLSIEARALQDAGWIEYRRGKLKILDPDGLENASCECYGLMRNVYSSFLPIA